MGETRIGQGRGAAKHYYRDNPNIASNVETQMREYLKNHSSAKSSKDNVSENSNSEDFPD